MLENILLWERDLFLFLNSRQSPLLDSATWLYSDWFVWIPFFAALLFFLIRGKSVRAWLPVVVSMILMTLACVLISDVLMKPHFARFRPAFHPGFAGEVKNLFNYKGEGLYGFASGHATFSFAFAVFTGLLFRYKPYGFVIFAWATLMAWSRIYLGVHFLTDVLAGAVIGSFAGLITYYLYRRFAGGHTRAGNAYPKREVLYLTIGLTSYVLLFVVFSRQIVSVLIRQGWIGG